LRFAELVDHLIDACLTLVAVVANDIHR
jgi:hypothetical protein